MNAGTKPRVKKSQGAKSRRAELLAKRIEEGAAGLADFAAQLSEEAWRAPVSSSAARRSRAGRSAMLLSSWRRQSKKYALIGKPARTASTLSLRPKRRMVIWKGCGRPEASTVIASPSMVASRGRAAMASRISG